MRPKDDAVDWLHAEVERLKDRARALREANSHQGKTMEQPVRNQHPFMAAVVRSIDDRTEAELKDLMAKLDELKPAVAALGITYMDYRWANFRNEVMEDARKQIEARLSNEAAEKLFHEGGQEIKCEIVKGEAAANIERQPLTILNEGYVPTFPVDK